MKNLIQFFLVIFSNKNFYYLSLVNSSQDFEYVIGFCVTANFKTSHLRDSTSNHLRSGVRVSILSTFEVK